MNASNSSHSAKSGIVSILFGSTQPYLVLSFISILVLSATSVRAQSPINGPHFILAADLSLPIVISPPAATSANKLRQTTTYRQAEYVQHTATIKMAGSLIPRPKLPPTTSQEQSSTAITSTQRTKAFVSVRMRKYGLALKLYYPSLTNKCLLPTPTGPQQNNHEKKGTVIDSLLTSPTIETAKPPKQQESVPISIKAILQSFKDGKKAVAYGFLIHIKQPAPGTRKTFKWFDDVGHSFITLSKYNRDGSMISCTYGYYPDRSFILQGTPLLPAASSQYKNDAFHDADETLGKLITARQFHKILRTTKKLATRKYHLNKNNCTDFVLKVAAIAGFHIEQTAGHWPLGHGNDPGDTGQSILEKKINCDCGNHFLFYALPGLQKSIRRLDTPR